MFLKFRAAVLILATLVFPSGMIVEGAPPAQPQSPAPVTVKMTPDHKFLPQQITIRVGQTVEWVNDVQGEIHEVTTDPDIAINPDDVSIPDGAMPFDSHLIKSGQSFQHQFTVPGAYQYVCPPHEASGMIGNVTVRK